MEILKNYLRKTALFALKKILFKLSLIAISLTFFQSCTINEQVTADIKDNDTISKVIEVTRNLNYNNDFTFRYIFNRPIPTSDMVLVYLLEEVVNGNDVWRPLPRIQYFSSSNWISYNFNFTSRDVDIFLNGSFDLNTLSQEWTNNQTFRILIIPAYTSNKMTVDYSNYDDVVKAYGLDKIKIVKF